MTFKVVILSARAANLAACVGSLVANEPELTPDRIVVVDDGARSEPPIPGVSWVPGIKPFIYARNANLGIQAAGADVILLNDDARLLTPRGFTLLAEEMYAHPTIGICSAGIHGAVGNLRQTASHPLRFRLEPHTLAFVCVFIPKEIYDLVGPLDEQFDGYGCEDNDYCARVIQAGYDLAIWDGCVVDHAGALPSTFRTRPDYYRSYLRSRGLFQAKWGSFPETFQVQAVEPRRARTLVAPPMAVHNQDLPAGRNGETGKWAAVNLVAGAETEGVLQDRCVDLLYLACNRLEFTQETFTTLIANTDWQYVRELVVYDDGSVDGTCEWLESKVAEVPAAARLLRTNFGSPVSAVAHFIEATQAPILAKLDNDAMYPPGWLRQSLEVLARHPELSLLGLEAMNPHQDHVDSGRSYTPAQFISGLGVYRRSAFDRSRPTPYNKYFGLEEWQVAQGSRLVRGWISPALPVFLLDRVPLDPWKTLSATYIQRGWQRSWPSYDPACTLWHWRWASGTALTSAHPIRLPMKLNLGCCDAPLDGYQTVSIIPVPELETRDLRGLWPWDDDSVAHIRAWDLLEHLPDRIATMNELWRILEPGGTAEVVVPTTDGTGAFQDPTHVSFWNRRTFFYFEEGNSYRERFAQAYGINAHFRVVHEHTDPTPDGPRLTLLLQAVKPRQEQGDALAIAEQRAAPAEVEDGAHAAPVHNVVPAVQLRTQPHFLCAMRIKNEAPHILEVLTRALALCEHAFVFDDHSTDDTVAICRSFGDRVSLFPSPFQGLDEARDKNYLLKQIVGAGPDWVLWIDGDEVLEQSGPQRLRQAAAHAASIASYWLSIAYIWNDPHHIRVDGIFGRFMRPSFFRLRGQPVERLYFPTPGHGGNFHCGNVPRGLVGGSRALNVRLKHLGYMTREQRLAKYAWYSTIDPNNQGEDNYRHLAEIPGARHAPGPPRIVAWSE